MLAGIKISSDSPVEDEDVGLEWYMNKSFKSTTVKVLNCVNGGLCRMRLMEDLLRGHYLPNKVELVCQGSTYRGSCSIAKLECDSSCDSHTKKMMSLTEVDEDDDIGKMTLKEMHRLFRRNAQKSSRKPSAALLDSVPLREAGSILENSVQLGCLELHLDSSTSNSEESGDDVSPRGAATSCHKPIDSRAVRPETLGREDSGPEPIMKKRKSVTDPLIYESVISFDDDECTLQMWQTYRRQKCSGKRSGDSAVEQACALTQHISCESSLPPPVTLEICSTNSAPRVADLYEPLFSTSLCPSDGAPLLDNNVSGSDTLSHPVVCEDLKDNNSLKPAHDAIAEDGPCSDGLYLNVKIEKVGKTSREDDESEQGHRATICEDSGACLWAGSPCKTDSGSNPMFARVSCWALRPCKFTDSSTSVQSKVDNPHRSTEELIITSCEVVQNSDDSAMLVLQNPAMKEPYTNKCSEANDSTEMESSVPPLQVINKSAIVCEPADNQITSFSQKTSVKETFPVDRSEVGSPRFAEAEKGLDIIEESSQNVGTVCQLSNEENSGSPLSLFSTERLDAEEEPELEQLKPSKIPCKRKAISPLSRERLLQASKFGERECACYEVDKRGLKRLPRSFKGFIGRDTSNHERNDGCTAKAGNTVMAESSPPEKPLHKEEVLPGSPCHNRKKLLSSKSFLPKVSLPSSYGDSVVAPNIATSGQPCLPSPSCVQRLSLVLNSSPSPPLQKNSKHGKSPMNLSPSIPSKGILRSSPPTCQGPCKCEECVSLRCRAERAAEFSQRQMHDIEGLAVKLLKELNTMRCVVEESLIQRTTTRVDSPPRPALNSDQVRRAASSALETEKMAKSWLVRMARDCNRYCKIMRIQERKLTFADESGGQLCHVKLFHSQPKPQPEADTMLLNAVKESTSTSCLAKEDSCCSGPGIEMASDDLKLT